MYEKLDVSFLIDPEDLLEVYEEKGKENGATSLGDLGEDILQNALSRLDRVQQIEVIHGYNEMKEALTEFLNGLAQSGQVITAEHINQFFQGMQANKRRRVDEVYIPDNCR
jgi:E3 ubiquitin-protein ligase UBR7